MKTWKLNKSYLMIQECDTGYDFTLLDFSFAEIDGGQLDAPQLTIDEARKEIMADYDLSDYGMQEVNYEWLADQAEEYENKLLEAIIREGMKGIETFSAA